MKTEAEYNALMKVCEELQAQNAKLAQDLFHQRNAYNLLAQAVRRETARTRHHFRWLRKQP